MTASESSSTTKPKNIATQMVSTCTLLQFYSFCEDNAVRYLQAIPISWLDIVKFERISNEEIAEINIALSVCPSHWSLCHY